MRSRVLGLALVAGLVVSGAQGCNLDFDASQYNAIEVVLDMEEQDAVDMQEDLGQEDAGPDQGDEQNNEEQVCVDNDQDTFGVGLACPKDQIDCDDRRQVVYPGAPEVCDNLDNDCDELFDEDADGQPLTQECYTGEASDLEAENTACRPGRVACSGGQFPSPVTPALCVGQVLPSDFGETEEPARCDGVDNDCDGITDPVCPCESAGQTRRCYTAGPPNKRGVGICVEGVQTCFEVEGQGRQWGECEDDVAPGAETCANMGSDDDCDGEEDNVPMLGESCETGEPGRCRVGTWRCVDMELSCVRNLNPTSEMCDEIDSDCDGDLNNGVDNACGGCGELEGEPGDNCGVCGDGTWTCSEMGEVSCVDARGLNACGGCGLLTSPVGSQCGVCGEYVCDGSNSVRCEDPGLNTCGGCGDINGAGLLDTRCGICGTYICDGPNNVRCQDAPTNACNGCAELDGEPGESCGVCGDGNIACDGSNAVRCVGASPLNACGGCQDLQGVSPGDNCGICGRQQCNPNNPGALTCNDPGTNACGGCADLDNAPGGSCGICGQYACGQDRNSTFCDDPGLNACGGCAELTGAPDADCGICGQYACDGGEAVTCDDPGLNACSGCGELQGQPGTECGVCGTWRCSLDGAAVNCQDPGTNICGGCGAVTGVETLGDACGVCGTVVCDETGNGVRCEDPGLNSCLACGELDQAPGSTCNGGCGFYVCASEGVTCDTRRCPSSPSLLRVLHVARGVPEFDVRVDGQIPVTNFEYTDRTVYVRLLPGDHTVEFFPVGTAFMGEPLFVYDFSLADGEQSTLLFYGPADGDYGPEDFLKIEDENIPAPDLVKLRFTNLILSNPPPVDENSPAQEPIGPTEIRFLNAELNVVHTISGVEYADTSAYTTMAPGRYLVQVYRVGNPVPFGNFGERIDFKGGEVLSLFHHGAVNGAQTITHHPSTIEERFFP